MKDLSNIYNYGYDKINTVAKCFLIKLKDGRKLGFTTNTRDVKFLNDPENVVYKSAGFTPTASSKSNSMSVDNLDSDLFIDHETIKQDDLEKGLFNNAEFKLFEFNWMKKPYNFSNISKEMIGVIGQVTRQSTESYYRFEFRSNSQYLQNNIGETLKTTCSNMFCDARCKLNKNDFTFETIITNVIDRRTFILNDLNNPTGSFKGGIIEVLSGQALGQKMEIKDWFLDDKKIILQLPLNYPVSNNDSIRLIIGCNKTFTRCIELNNSKNFKGFPHVPGQDKITGAA